ncbi:MAG: hypothetical protein HFJ79_00240 [Clostridiales bacterium]|jgi:hypothetical protein|nr:hypothetical protein [Clostridiales bacterium]
MDERELDALRDAVIGRAHPDTIILFSQKRGLDGRLSSVKLCVVADCESPRRLERELYLQVESDLPYDVLCYRPSEWECLCRDGDSFAARIRRSGRVLYEK